MAEILPGTKANDLDAFIGSIPDTQLIIVPDPVTGKLLRSTFGQLKADIILAFGSLSYLDQIIEVPQVANLPQPGEVKKIYVITGEGPDQNKQFRWGGSVYIEFPAGSGDVAGEAIIRGNADADLQAQIEAEATARQSADTALQTNITAEATARENADTLLSQQITSEKNSRTTNDNILQGIINAEGATRLTADNALSARIDTKVEQITGMGLSSNDYTTAEKNKLASIDATHYGVPLQSITDLQAITSDDRSDKQRHYVEDELSDYFYDAQATVAGANDVIPDDQVAGTGIWKKVAVGGETAASIKSKYESNADTNAYTNAEKEKLSGIEAGAQVNPLNTDSLTEGATNKYFTVVRVLATLLTGLSVATGGDIIATDSVLAAFGKIQARFNDLLTTFNVANKLVKLDANAKLPAIDGSQLTNLPAGGGASDNYAVATGTNTYAVTIPGLTALTEGMSLRIKFTNGNTGASSLNPNGFGAISITKGPSTALTAGVITAGQIFELYYDGSVFQLGSVQVVPTAANKVITTNSSGELQAANDLIDVNSTTTEATLIAADWSNGHAIAPGVAGTKVYGLLSQYLYECSGPNTWWRTPLIKWIDLYLADVSDGAGVKTSTQMSALYPSAILGNKVKGTAGLYEYVGGFLSWIYTPGYEGNAAGTASFSGDGSTVTFHVSYAANITLPSVVLAVPNSADAVGNFYVTNITISGFDIVYKVAPAAGTNNISFKFKAIR